MIMRPYGQCTDRSPSATPTTDTQMTPDPIHDSAHTNTADVKVFANTESADINQRELHQS